MDRSHVIEHDLDLLDLFIAQRLQRLDGLGFSGSGIAHQHDALLLSVLQGDVDESAVDRQPSLLHHRQVVQRQRHLLEIAEVFDALVVADTADPHVFFLIMVEGRLILAVLIAEQADQIRLLLTFLFVGQLEEIAQRDGRSEEITMEVDKG